MKSKNQFLFIVTIILAVILILSGCSKTKLTNEQRNEGYKRIYESRMPDIREYWSYIPLILQDGLEYDEIRQTDKKTDFRTITTSKGEEQVSIINGFRIMYKYPNTDYFVKMHVEKSKPEEYENDKLKVIDELSYLSKGNISKGNYRDYEYYFIENTNLNYSPITIVLIFYPDNQIITTIYFLNQKPENRKFQTFEEYTTLKNIFINELIDNKLSEKLP